MNETTQGGRGDVRPAPDKARPPVTGITGGPVVAATMQHRQHSTPAAAEPPSTVQRFTAAIVEAEGLALDNDASELALATLRVRALLSPGALDASGRLDLRHALAVLCDVTLALRELARDHASGPEAARLWFLNERFVEGVTELADLRDVEASQAAPGDGGSR